MSTIAPESTTSTDAAPAPAPSELLQLRDEVHRQGTSIRTSQRSFSIFAVFALMLAFGTMLAVVYKLDAKTKTTTPPGTSQPAAAPVPVLGHSVVVGLGEFFVRPSVTAAAAGQVRFTVHNGGAATHEFVVLRTDTPAGSLPKDKNGRADEAGNVGETGELAAGASKTITVKLAAGHYALVCNLPGHYKAGQHTDFTVH
jgi:uncharacterized cupredoxin-like copper-binding protein